MADYCLYLPSPLLLVAAEAEAEAAVQEAALPAQSLAAVQKAGQSLVALASSTSSAAAG